MVEKKKSNKLYKSIIQKRNEKNLDLATLVHKSISLGRSNPTAFAFIITSLNLIYGREKEFTFDELCKIITDGNNDYGIDAIFEHKNYFDIFDVSSENPADKEIITLEKCIRDNIVSKPKDFTIFNTNLADSLKKIHKSSKAIRNKRIRLYIIRNSDWKKENSSQLKSIEKLIESINGEFIYLNQLDIVNRVCEPENYLPQWNIEIEDDNDVFFVDDNNKEVFLKIKVSTILELQNKNEKMGFNLFNKNVRTFLKNRTLSKAIKETIDKKPSEFHIYHNGISIVTPKKIEKKQGSKFVVKFPQVVNGAQTINSLYFEFKKDLKNKKLNTAKILCKIITAEPDFIDRICETSNTQLPIKLSDLRSNDDIFLKIQEYLNVISNKYQFIRKTKTNKVAGKTAVSMPEFIQWFYSVKFKDPSGASNRKKYLFDVVSENGLYNKIKEKLEETILSPEELLLLCDIANYVKLKIRRAPKEKKGLLKDAKLHLIAALSIKQVAVDVNIDSVFNALVDFIEGYVNDKRTIQPDITNNKIFTKDHATFVSLLRHSI